MKAWASVDAWKFNRSSDEILPRFELEDISDFGVEHRIWLEEVEEADDIDERSTERSDNALELVVGELWPSSDLV